MNAMTRHPKIHAGIIIPSKGPIHRPSSFGSRCCAVELSGKVSGFDELCKRIMENIIRLLCFVMQIKLQLRTILLITVQFITVRKVSL